MVHLLRAEKQADARQAPVMITVLRLAGALACVAGAGLLDVAFWAETARTLSLLLAAAAGVVGLTFLSFAANLVMLHGIRAHLQNRCGK